MGQPTAWPAMARTNPNAPDGDCSSGRNEWAAQPANSARARLPRKASSDSPRADRIALRPNRASPNGYRAIRNGERSAAHSSSQSGTSGPINFS